MMRLAVAGVIAAIFGAGGCKTKAPPTEPHELEKAATKSEPVTASPKTEPPAKDAASMVWCRGELCEGGRSLPMTADGVLSIMVSDCEGCTLEIDGKRLVAEKGKWLGFDVLNAIGDADADGIERWRHLQIPTKITLPDGRTLPPSMLELGSSVPTAIVFNRVAKGPLAFEKDKSISAPRAAIVVRAEPHEGIVMHLGPAKRLRDFDLVGIAVGTEKPAGTCGGHSVNGVSLDVTLYDRRTGKILGKKIFPPPSPDCFQLATGFELVATSPELELANWVDDFLN